MGSFLKYLSQRWASLISRVSYTCEDLVHRRHVESDKYGQSILHVVASTDRVWASLVEKLIQMLGTCDDSNILEVDAKAEGTAKTLRLGRHDTSDDEGLAFVVCC